MRIRATHRALLAASIILVAITFGCGGGGGSTGTVYKHSVPAVSAPASFIALASSGSVTLSWSPVSGVNSYRIYRSNSPLVSKTTGFLLISGLSPTMTTYRDAPVTNGTPYYYVMTSIKDAIESAESPVVSATPGSLAGTIQGTILYEDKEYSGVSLVNGNFTGVTRWKPVRYADVDVVMVSSPYTVLYSTQTDSRGRYLVPVTPSATVVKVSVNSTATPTGGIGSISVKKLSSTLYAVPSDPFPLSAAAGVSIGISVANLASGAFNILDVMATGYDFVKYHNGAYPVVPLDAYWQQGNSNGTFFCTGYCSPLPGPGIYVYSITGVDTDEFDDDVLWHEFGHFLAYTYSVDQSEGGYHYLSDVDHDLRFSWSEGWGDFFPGAIKSWLAATDPARLSTPAGLSPTLYVDTPTFSFDFGSATLPLLYSYASGEVAVAKVLHGMRSTFSMQDIWDTFTSFSTAVTLTRPPNLELFWDRWLASKPVSTGGTTVQSIFAERLILYQDDAYENDDSLVTAKTITVGVGQADRTLFADGDWDHVQFTPAANTSYTIRTSSLRNGADTYLELYNNFGLKVAFNDNTNNVNYLITPPTFGRENGSDILGSTIQFTSSLSTPTGPYVIKIFSSLGKPASAGRYGTYNLLVTSP